MSVHAVAAAQRIVGPARSGKTEVLVQRIVRALREDTALAPAAIVVASAHALAARRLAARVRAAGVALAESWHGATLPALAFALLEEHWLASGLALDLEQIEDVDAEAHFERVAGSLFALDWIELVPPEIGDPSIDFEVAGLRAPERFARAAYRLFRKLRGAGIGPERFAQIALRKSAQWYAHPPNLINPDLLFGTPERYRASLTVDAAELERQRRREIDLAKVLARTYELYVADTLERGCLTGVDAVAEASALCRRDADVAARVRTRWPLVFIDDAQDLSPGDLELLEAVYGAGLAGVTFCGDPEGATRTFAGARPERIFPAGSSVETAPGPIPPMVRFAQRFVRHDIGRDPDADVRVRRAATPAAEAAEIARDVRGRLDAGTPGGEIAVLVRSLRGAQGYIEALLARDVPLRLLGDLDLFAQPDVEDALALLHAANDPFRHDWLLRALQTPTLQLADATLHLLCGEPTSAQTALFTDIAPPDETRRWDRERDLRLGRNVTRGDRDAELPAAARERLERFRAMRLRWADALERRPLEEAARAIVIEGGLFAAASGETPARSSYRARLLERLLRRLRDFAAADRTRRLDDFLRYVETIGVSEWPHCDADDEPGGVTVASIESVNGEAFADVYLPNIRAGAFPPYYVPDAFIFTTKYGVIPKENVGDAKAARTAKFSWYSHGAHVKEHFADEHRRLLASGMSRATRSLTLSAPGTPTRGVGAPEFLVEIERSFAQP